MSRGKQLVCEPHYAPDEAAQVALLRGLLVRLRKKSVEEIDAGVPETPPEHYKEEARPHEHAARNAPL